MFKKKSIVALLIIVSIVVTQIVAPLHVFAACTHSFASATCTKPTRCTKCGFTAGSPLGHKYSSATCTSAKKCTRCGATSGSSLGHSYSSATCTSPKKCSRCGIYSGGPLGHSYSGATCTSPAKCSRCSATSGSSLGHNYSSATCTSAKKCSRCGTTSGSSLGHNYSSATCTSAKKCTRCGISSGSALGHSYSSATCTSPKKCSRCGISSGGPLGHSYSGATCTSPAKCSRCSATSGSSLGHNYSSATCTSAKKCSRCGSTSGSSLGHNYSSATCTSPAKCSRCSSTLGYPLGHNYSNATCTSAKKCSRCGTTSGSALGHSYSSATCTQPPKCIRCSYYPGGSPLGHSITSVATCTNAAYCSRCGTVGSSLGHNYSNATCTSPTKCSRCSSTLGYPLGHDITSNATCTSADYCSRCGSVGSSLGHNYSIATCTSPAQCSRCSSISGYPLGHNITSNATCSSAAKCSRCGIVGSSLGHNYSNATCTSPAKCSRCSSTLGYPLGHDITSYATCTSADNCSRCGSVGSPLRHDVHGATCTESPKCSRCSFSPGGSPLGHDITSAATCTSAAYCSRCGIVGTALGHDPIDPTCTQPAHCDRCGYEYPNSTPLGHNITIPATCTSAAICSRCGAVGDPLDHDMLAPTCTSNVKCELCGYEVPNTMSPHIYGAWITHSWHHSDGCFNPDNPKAHAWHSDTEEGHSLYRECINCGNLNWDEVNGEKLATCPLCYPEDPEGGSGEDPDTLGTPLVVQPSDDSTIPYSNVLIGWNTVDNATSGVTKYHIKVVRSSNNQVIIDNDTTATSYTINASQLTIGETYTVTVKASQTDMTSSQESSPVSFTVIENSIPSIQLFKYNGTVLAETSSPIVLNGAGISQVISLENSGWSPLFPSVSNTVVTLYKGTQVIQISSLSSEAKSYLISQGWSSGKIKVIDVKSDSITVSITDPAGKTLKVFEKGSLYRTIPLTGADTVKTISGLTPNTAYIFQLYAAGASVYESADGATTLSGAPVISTEDILTTDDAFLLNIETDNKLPITVTITGPNGYYFTEIYNRDNNSNTDVQFTKRLLEPGEYIITVENNGYTVEKKVTVEVGPATQIWLLLDVIQEYQAKINNPGALFGEDYPTPEAVEAAVLNFKHSVMYLQMLLLENEYILSNPLVSQYLAENLLSGYGIDIVSDVLVKGHLRDSDPAIDSVFGEFMDKTWREFGSLVLNIIPIVGSIKSIAEGVVGYDLLTGRQFTWWERALNIGFGALSLVGEVSMVVSAMRNSRLVSKLYDIAVIAKNTTVQKMANAISGIRSAMKTSTEALKNTVTKVFSRINGTLDLEYAGIGRVQFDEIPLIDDADLISQQRWKNHCEAMWAETAGDLIDDAAETIIDGQQYIKNGRIKVLKSDVTYTTNGYTYQTDSLGRITNADGSLQLIEAPRNDYAQKVVGRIDRLSTDQGGHLIGSRFNGSGNLDNLVPMDSNLNQGAWKTMENTWANALSEGKEVTVDIKAVYQGVSQRPTDFIVKYFIDGEEFIKRFANTAGG